MKPIKIYTGITNGLPQDLGIVENAFRHFEGVAVDITVERHRTKRTSPQNKYLWAGVFGVIADHINKTSKQDFIPQDVHDYYVRRGYFGFKPSIIDQEEIPKGTSEATTIEFMEAVARIQREWAERGLIILDPQQTDFLEE